MRCVNVDFGRLRVARWAMLVMLVLSGCSAFQQAEVDRRIGAMIANAKSPSDHDAIAAAYEEEAAGNREQAAAHLKIAQSYAGRPRVKFDYSTICRQMAQEYTDLANKDAELATQHRGIAEKMRADAAGTASP